MQVTRKGSLEILERPLFLPFCFEEEFLHEMPFPRLSLSNNNDESFRSFCRYMNAAKIDDEILIEATAKKIGRKLAFFECELRNKDSNKLLVTGSHTKFMQT